MTLKNSQARRRRCRRCLGGSRQAFRELGSRAARAVFLVGSFYHVRSPYYGCNVCALDGLPPHSSVVHSLFREPRLAVVGHSHDGSSTQVLLACLFYTGEQCRRHLHQYRHPDDERSRNALVLLS